jgi:PAS domain S-box-containing protein
MAWAMLRALPDGVLMVDGRGRIVFANPAAEVLFGYERGALLGEDVDTLVPPAFRETHRAHRERFNAAPRTRAMGAGLVLHGVRRDGTEFNAEVSLSPLVDGSNRLTIAAVRPLSDTQRSQLAREVLDTVIYRLVAIAMSLQAVLEGPADALQRRAVEVVERIDDTIHEIRTTIYPTDDNAAT